MVVVVTSWHENILQCYSFQNVRYLRSRWFLNRTASNGGSGKWTKGFFGNCKPQNQDLGLSCDLYTDPILRVGFRKPLAITGPSYQHPLGFQSLNMPATNGLPNPVSTTIASFQMTYSSNNLGSGLRVEYLTLNTKPLSSPR